MLDGWLILLLLFTFLSLKSALNMGQFEGTISDSVLRGKSNHGTKPGHHNKPHLNEKTLAIVVGTQKGVSLMFDCMCIDKSHLKEFKPLI